MLQNAYLLAKIGADTAENEQHFAEICQKLAIPWWHASIDYELEPTPGRCTDLRQSSGIFLAIIIPTKCFFGTSGELQWKTQHLYVYVMYVENVSAVGSWETQPDPGRPAPVGVFQLLYPDFMYSDSVILSNL